MMPLKDFAGMVSGVTAMEDGSFMATCPACEGDGALRFGLRADGSVWVRCLEDCRPAAICNALGLKTTDLTGEPIQKVVSTKDGKVKKVRLPDPIKVTYDYTYPDGSLAFQVCEKESGTKTVRVPDPDHKGKFKFGLGSQGVRPLPYHLPDIVKAMQGAYAFVFVCPDEQDADAIRGLDCVATCSLGAADAKVGGWLDEFCKFFSRVGDIPRVFILPRRDKGPRDPEDVAGAKTAYADSPSRVP
jgi:hypothetical protein